MYETLNDLIMYAESCDNLWLLNKLKALKQEIQTDNE